MERIQLEYARAALKAFAPPVPDPPLAALVTPVAGSTWQAGKALEDGRYFDMKVNAGLAALEALPQLGAARTAQNVTKVEKAMEYARKPGSRPMTAKNVQKAFAKAGFTGGTTGREAHHTFPLKGTPRNVVDIRNHPALIEPRLIANHRRLTGSWQGQPRFDPLRRAWYGSSDLLKQVAAGVGAYAGDVVADLSEERQSPYDRERGR